MEDEGHNFFKRIRVGYKKIKEKNSNRCFEIDAHNSPEHIFMKIKKIIIEKFKGELVWN